MIWNWDQWKAIGRHGLTFAAGLITMAVTVGIFAPDQAQILLTALTDIQEGAAQFAKGVAAIAGVAIPIYTALRAARAANPNVQAKSLANNMSTLDPSARIDVIKAVADNIPAVKAVVTTPQLAQSVPSDKVIPLTDIQKVI